MQKMIIKSPVDGEVIRMEDVPDPVFSEKMIGDGVAIIPSSTHFYPPVDGEITVVFPTSHAIGIKSRNPGPIPVELLLHIGINSVSLNGEGFISHIKQGDSVNLDNKLVQISSLELIKNDGVSPETILLIPNDSNEGWKIVEMASGKIKRGEKLMVIEREEV